MEIARPKEFDQERALHRAISIFSQKGFAATSTDDLMRAMDVGRQSMYDTFGDKRALFLKALEVYVTEKVRSINVELRAPGSPLASIRRALVHFAERRDLSSTDGCMGINAICEFGMIDEDVKSGHTFRRNVQDIDSSGRVSSLSQYGECLEGREETANHSVGTTGMVSATDP